uniref:Uncharacterized protein n=1 Tax=Calidris pygmaea TaxID=425635 RepID=A0A8C3J547_9CHAR
MGKSSKAKEKKQKRLEERAAMDAVCAKVEAANKLEDPLEAFPVFKKYDRNGSLTTGVPQRVGPLHEEDEGMECPLSELAGGTKLGGVVDATRRLGHHPVRRPGELGGEEPDEVLPRAKRRVLPLGRSNPLHPIPFGGDLLESSSEEKDLGVLVANEDAHEPTMGPGGQEKADGLLGEGGEHQEERGEPQGRSPSRLCSALGRSHLENWDQFRAPPVPEGWGTAGEGLRGCEDDEGPEHLSAEERLKDLGFFF